VGLLTGLINIKRLFGKQILSFLILFIFTLKMATPILTFISSNIKEERLSTLITQMETETQKEAETKEGNPKDFFFSTLIYNFSIPPISLSKLSVPLKVVFYDKYFPSIPTPPPDFS
jgi:hypothetical protein